MENNISRLQDDHKPDTGHKEGRSGDKNFSKLSRKAPVRVQTLREAMDEIARDDSGLAPGADGVPESPLNRAQAAAAKNTTPGQWQAHLKRWFPSGP